MKTNSLIVIALFMSVLLLGGCSKSSEMEHYARLVEYWQGREIKLPDVMTDVLTGDTIDFSDADFTILTYVDSAGCTGCRMKLPMWNEFIETIDTLTDASVNFIIIVGSKNIKGIKYLLESNDYNYPVVIDPQNKIVGKNDFPTDPDFQTFIIDRRFKVLALGNPLRNNRIAKLFKSILSGQTIFDDNGMLVALSEETSFNVGTVLPGDSATHDFMLSNSATDTLHIKKILTSCECVEVRNPPKYILPQETVSLTVSYKADSITKGPFYRMISIHYFDIDTPTLFKIQGMVE